MFYFVSKNRRWCDSIQNLFQTEIDNQIIQIHCQKIQQFISESDGGKTNKIFISPSNSLGRMEGGMDLIMSRQIFPGIHLKLAKIIKKLGLFTYQNILHLPIGGSVFIPDVKNRSGCIIAPTMFNSANVGHTQNAFISLLSSLILFQKIKEHDNINYDLVITSHCCGNGAMDESEASQQFRNAWDSFQQQNYPNEIHYYNFQNLNTSYICLLPYTEKEREYSFVIDENDVKTIKITTDYMIKDS